MKASILLLLLSVSSFASNWMPINQIQPGSKSGYQLQAECERAGEACLDVGDKPEYVTLGMVSVQDGALVLDDEAISSYEEQRSASLQAMAALEHAKKLRECGVGVMDLVLVRNALKQPPLNTTQVKQIVATYASIKGLLETGSLNSAKEEVEDIDPDGTLVTSGDKAAVTAAIDACLAQ